MPQTHKHDSECHTEHFSGPREDMLKRRAETKADSKKQIDKFLADYDGGLIVMVTANNEGESTAVKCLAVGCSDGPEQVGVLKGLRKTEAELLSHMQPADDPMEMLRALLQHSK